VLVVDDDPAVARAMSLILAHAGYEVEVAGGGREALARARATRFSIVVTDLRMPGMDGGTLIGRIAERSPETQFLIVTGVTELDLHRELSRGPSVVSVLTKPWGQDELTDAVARAWELHVEHAHAPEPDADRERVLVIEDDPFDIVWLKRELERTGAYEVVHCVRLTDGLAAARESRVAAILTDLSLPDARGLDAIVRLRQARPDLPLIAVSGLDDEALSLQALRLGAQDFCVKDVQARGALARALRYAFERKHAENQLRRLADYDGLTGAVNRRAFETRTRAVLGRARRRGAVCGIGLIDLDRFKEINDTHGHEAGDDVLKAVTARCATVLREYDVFARLGGDEFAFLLDDLDDASNADSIVARMMNALRQPIETSAGQTLSCTASIGLALYPGAGETLEELLGAADAAMYAAKARGRNQHEIHFGDPSSPVARRFRVESELRRAVDRDELRVVYQPQIELASGRVVAYEALARWTRPGGSECPPSEFVPALERTGLIHRAGQAILEQACAQLRAWRDGGRAVRMAVNVSAAQLGQPGFAGAVARTLHRYALPADQLALEIAESALMTDTRSTRDNLGALSALGVRLEIDDFGTGYCSLRYLRQFHVDALKLDRTFVECLERHDASIASAIIALAERMDIEVVAEGVETVAQLEALRALGCDLAQGYLLGRPRPPGDLWGVPRAGTERRSAVP